MPCTHLEMNIPFFVRCSVHHAMNVASKSMGSRDAQIEDILASPTKAGHCPDSCCCSCCTSFSRAPHIDNCHCSAAARGRFALCGLSCLYSLSPTAREYDCVLLGIPAVIIEKTYQDAAGKPVIFTVPRCGFPCDVAFPRALLLHWI